MQKIKINNIIKIIVQIIIFTSVLTLNYSLKRQYFYSTTPIIVEILQLSRLYFLTYAKF